MMKKLQLKSFYATSGNKNTDCKGSGKRKNDVKCQVTVVQNWFSRFKESNTSLKNKTRSGRSSVVEDEASLEIAEYQPSTSTCSLSAELGLSPNTANRHSYKLGLYGGACGVMVTVVGNGHGDTSSIPGRDWLHFT